MFAYPIIPEKEAAMDTIFIWTWLANIVPYLKQWHIYCIGVQTASFLCHFVFGRLNVHVPCTQLKEEQVWCWILDGRASLVLFIRWRRWPLISGWGVAVSPHKPSQLQYHQVHVLLEVFMWSWCHVTMHETLPLEFPRQTHQVTPPALRPKHLKFPSRPTRWLSCCCCK